MNYINELKSAKHNLEKEVNKLLGIRSSYVAEKAIFFQKLSTADNYLTIKDEIAESLAKLHQKTQEGSVKLYEDLLTTLVHEIMPNNDECERVVLEQGLKRGKPTLNIKIMTAKGKKRDIATDKGGSIQNIISIGLRFIYVSRMPGRNFIVLDEADAGLAAENMSRFARMIDSLSRKTGIQVIYISHHKPENFKGFGRLHQLKRRNGKISSNILFDYEKNAESKDVDNEYGCTYSESFLRYIRLSNCMQHENTVLELSPFVNYIVGSNDIGKSAVSKIFKAMATNNCPTSYIRDEQSELKFEIGIENNQTFEYSYKAKGVKKTLYRVMDSDGTVIESSNDGDKIPSFMCNYFSFDFYKNVCPSISDQKNSSFIFDNDKVSEHERAEILGLDDNADIVQKMIARHHELVREYQAEKRTAQVEINKLKNKLEHLRVVDAVESQIEQLETLIQGAENSMRNAEFAKHYSDNISRLSADINLINEVKVDVFNSEYEVRKFISTDIVNNIEGLSSQISAINSLNDIATDNSATWKETRNISSVMTPMIALNEHIRIINSLSDLSLINIVAKPTSKIKKIVIGMNSVSESINLIDSLSDITLNRYDIEVRNQRNVKRYGTMINGLSQEIKASHVTMISLESTLKKDKDDLENLMMTYSQCPLCKQSIQHNHKGN